MFCLSNNGAWNSVFQVFMKSWLPAFNNVPCLKLHKIIPVAVVESRCQKYYYMPNKELSTNWKYKCWEISFTKINTISLSKSALHEFKKCISALLTTTDTNAFFNDVCKLLMITNWLLDWQLNYIYFKRNVSRPLHLIYTIIWLLFWECLNRKTFNSQKIAWKNRANFLYLVEIFTISIFNGIKQFIQLRWNSVIFNGIIHKQLYHTPCLVLDPSICRDWILDILMKSKA